MRLPLVHAGFKELSGRINGVAIAMTGLGTGAAFLALDRFVARERSQSRVCPPRTIRLRSGWV